MPKSKPKPAGSINNRRARHDYDLKGGFVVGIALTGAETKSLRMGHGHIKGAYVTVKNDELYLINATINGTNNVQLTDSEQTRARKLLAKRKEIEELIAQKQQGQTIVPLEILTRGRFIKVRIAVGRGKKLYDKRQNLKKRDETRDAQRAIRAKS